MQKRVAFFLFVFALLLFACGVTGSFVRGNGKLVSEDRSVSVIHAVELGTAGEMNILVGDTESLKIEAEENLLPYLETTVSNGVLSINQKPGTNINPTRDIKYTLSVKSLDSLATSSSGSITAPALQSDAFKVDISSSGNINIDSLTTGSLTVSISSSGNLEIAGGQVAEQTITISSSGNHKAGDLQSQSAKVNISSSGNATIWVTDALDARISSSGNIEVYGRPVITQDLTSNGKIKSLGDK